MDTIQYLFWAMAIIMCAVTSIGTYMACSWLQSMPNNAKETGQGFGPKRTSSAVLVLVWIIFIAGMVAYFSGGRIAVVLGIVAAIFAIMINATTYILAMLVISAKRKGAAAPIMILPILPQKAQ